MKTTKHFPILKKGVYAIEPEISTYFYDENFTLDYHSESEYIKELIGLHDLDEDEIEKDSKKIYEYYKDKKPIGEDGYISGGWHIHIFQEDLIDTIKDIGSKGMKYLLLNNPFWVNYKTGRIILRKVNSRASLDCNDTEFYENSKSKPFCLKYSYYSHREEGEELDNESFEIRVNDVMDGRVFVLYKAMILAKKEGTLFQKTTEDLRNFLKKGITKEYTREVDIDYSDLSFDNLIRDGYKLTEEDKGIIINNLLVLNKFIKHSNKFDKIEKENGTAFIKERIKAIKEKEIFNYNTSISYVINGNMYNIRIEIKDSKVNYNYIKENIKAIKEKEKNNIVLSKIDKKLGITKNQILEFKINSFIQEIKNIINNIERNNRITLK